MDTKMQCTCNGEAHDECRPCTDCGGTPALNDVDHGHSISYYCDECWEAMVEAEEREFQERRVADERGE